MWKRVISIGFILVSSIIQMVEVESTDFELNELIKIEVRGSLNNPGIFEIARDATFEDLLKELQLKEEADISSISMQKTFVNEEVITIPIYKEDKKISINEATLEELMTLKGIGETIAKAIIDYRNKHHGFKELDELLEVKGIGLKKYETIKDDICL